MEISGLLSGLVVGIIIGLIARILVPSMQPIGCFVTILIGVVGGAGGALAVIGNNIILVGHSLGDIDNSANIFLNG